MVIDQVEVELLSPPSEAENDAEPPSEAENPFCPPMEVENDSYLPREVKTFSKASSLPLQQGVQAASLEEMENNSDLFREVKTPPRGLCLPLQQGGQESFLTEVKDWLWENENVLSKTSGREDFPWKEFQDPHIVGGENSFKDPDVPSPSPPQSRWVLGEGRELAGWNRAPPCSWLCGWLWPWPGQEPELPASLPQGTERPKG